MPAISVVSRKKLRPLQLAAVIFFTVSGGPYGLEPLLSYAGNHAALLLLMITPLLWDIPTILTVLELNSMMPVNGGYYQWVKRALGLRWAFYEGWWTWLYTFADLAIYPVLFVQYAAFFFPAVLAYKIPVCLVLIWSGALLNILGIVPVGKTALLLSAVVLTPFLLLFILSLQHHGNFIFPALSLKGVGFSATGMALYTIMWNFIGWDNTTTYAEEVDRPIRTYLVATGIGLFTVFAIYFLTTLTAINMRIDPAFLNENGFPSLGSLLGGPWLGALIAAGGMASMLGIFSAVLLSVSRVPKVMADDRLLPRVLTRLHKRFNTPYLSIILCSLIVSCMIIWTFADLIIIDVTLYGSALLLEYISLVVLRIQFPREHRPFRIPLNIVGLCILLILPAAVLVTALTGAFEYNNQTIRPLLFAGVALLTAEVGWLLTRIAGRKKSP